MTDFNALPIDSYYPGTDVLVSNVPKLNVMRLEARRDVLADRKASHGISPKGETILAGCLAALKGLQA